MNEVYVGVRKYGDVRIPDAHEPIVPAPLWRKAVKKLGYRYTSKGDGFERLDGPVTRTKGDGHVLGSEQGKGALVRCGECGGSLVKGSANGSYPILRCLQRGSGHPSISYDNAREFIVSETIRHIGWTKQHKGGNAEEVAAAEARLRLAREALADVEASENDPDWTPLAYGKALAKAQREVEEAEEALAALEPSEGTIRFLTPLGTRQHFDRLSVPEQRQVLHGVIERATLLADSRGKPASERLVIEFKDGTVLSKAALDAQQANIAAQIAEAVAPAGSDSGALAGRHTSAPNPSCEYLRFPTAGGIGRVTIHPRP